MALVLVGEGEAPPDGWERSVFLLVAGPTGRRDGIVDRLRSAGFDGVVFVPEDPSAAQTEEASEYRRAWHGYWVRRADVVLVWLEPGGDKSGRLVVCARIGELVDTGRLVVGVAGDQPGAGPLRRWVNARRVPVSRTLEETVDNALAIMPVGELRHGVERDVPLPVWQDHTFQRWLGALREAGNELLGLESVWSLRRGRFRQVVLSVLLPRIRIAAEEREEFGEVVVIRPDQAALLLYWLGPTLMDTTLVLVQDARVSARTTDGYIWELPSGSAGTTALRMAAVWEAGEEIGLYFDPDRLRDHGARQVLSSLSAHVCQLFSVPGTEREREYVLSQVGFPHGVHSEQEFTIPRVVTVRELFATPADWPTLGMVLSALHEMNLPGDPAGHDGSGGADAPSADER